MDVQPIDHVAASSGPAVITVQREVLQAFPAAPDPSQHHVAEQTLHSALSKLVGGGAQVSVQYRVVNSHEIVTVFKNADTGEVITQFPPEQMVQIAQFFNKLAGAVVDRTA